MTDRELMQQALDALEKHTLVYETAELLRARLLRIRCIVKDCQNHRHEGKFVGNLCDPCHTFITTGEGKYSQAYRNTQRVWQGLTEGETIELALSAFALPEVSSETREKIHRDLVIAMNDQDSRLMLFAANIEAKLKEKNNG